MTNRMRRVPRSTAAEDADASEGRRPQKHGGRRCEMRSSRCASRAISPSKSIVFRRYYVYFARVYVYAIESTRVGVGVSPYVKSGGYVAHIQKQEGQREGLTKNSTTSITARFNTFERNTRNANDKR